MNYLSVCSGIEAASVAWEPLGWHAIAFAEIEPFPCAVLAHHYPDVPNFGDMTRFKDWPDADFDVLVGGTPCQSFSIAGLRKGLADPRGNLSLTYLAIADRYRPRWLVWENVPGVRSSDEGRAFGAFLGGLGELGYGWAYRSLDAQYFGLAQRRERVFVVAHLGDWRRAAAVLFEPESLQWDSPPRREAGERVADSLTVGANQYSGFDASEDGTGRGTPIVAFDARQADVLVYGDKTGPIDTGFPGPAIAFTAKDHGADAGELAPTLRSMGHDGSHPNGGGQVAVALDLRNALRDPDKLDEMNRQGAGIGDDCSHTLSASAEHGVQFGHQVRRLTPRECERLQGFPDDYTMVPYRNKPAADGPRYKALGNSMAVPVMAWIGERISMVDEIKVAA